MNKKIIFITLFILLLVIILAYLTLDSNAGGIFQTAMPTITFTTTPAVGNTNTLGITSTATGNVPSSNVVYQLKVSSNQRYLVDQNNVPFLITGDAEQAMIGALSEMDANTVFTNRQDAGINSVWVHVLCGQSYPGCYADGSTFDGIHPFTTPGDLSTPNPAYFTRVDHILALADSHNLTVFLSPIETINWMKVLRSNGTTKAFNYGVFLGNRYKNTPNLVWIHGNDFQSWQTPSDDAVVRAVADGIKSVDPNHLHTVELDYPTSASLNDSSWSSDLGLNLAYSYYSTYDQVLREYNRTNFIPVYFHEGVYEFQNYAGGYTGPHELCTQAYWTQLSGAAGNFYGNRYIFRFESGWQNHLSDTGFREFSYWHTFFSTRPWFNLIPDQTHTVATAGYGTYEPISAAVIGNTRNYAATAYTPDGRLVLSYIPTNTTSAVSIDMSKLSGLTTARWFDPTTNSYQSIADLSFSNSGTRSFIPPATTHYDGSHDWPLVLEVNPAPIGDEKCDGCAD